MCDLFIPLGVAAGVPYISVILISLWASDKSFTVKMALISSILTVLGFLYSPSGGELWKVLFNRTIALFAIWVTALLTLQKKTIEDERIKMLEEKKKLIEETKVLKGLLPICASCKKIRDNEGYWNQIETYIEKYSDAYFCYGICKDCQKKGHLNL